MSAAERSAANFSRARRNAGPGKHISPSLRAEYGVRNAERLAGQFEERSCGEYGLRQRPSSPSTVQA